MSSVQFCTQCGKEFVPQHGDGIPLVASIYCQHCCDFLKRRQKWKAFGAILGSKYIVCPWCWYEHEDSPEWDLPSDSIYNFPCEQCHKRMDIDVNVDGTFDVFRTMFAMPVDFGVEDDTGDP